ncbi:hypothetical protein D9M68_761460 [compost metagenome]
MQGDTPEPVAFVRFDVVVNPRVWHGDNRAQAEDAQHAPGHFITGQYLQDTLLAAQAHTYPALRIDTFDDTDLAAEKLSHDR